MIEPKYIVTGVTGHLGNVIVRKLLLRGCEVIGLLYPGEKNLIPEIQTVEGDITKRETLKPLFEAACGAKVIVIHCAGRVSIRSDEAKKLWQTNVVGTRNMVDLAMEYQVSKFIYISSVHAIPELLAPQIMTEIKHFDPEKVTGDYAKTKAAATQYVLEACKKGLKGCVVHPSGLIGPYDFIGGQMMTIFKIFLKGGLQVGIEGGYDFVDVRDVADGVIRCTQKGREGECYILSGRFYTVRELLEGLAKVAHRQKPWLYIKNRSAARMAPFVEKLLTFLHLKSSMTVYSIFTLQTNARFSHEKAERELGYTVRKLEDTLADTFLWIQSEKQKD